VKQSLTTQKLFEAAKEFCLVKDNKNFPDLVGITDGKAIGTAVEHRIKNFLTERFEVEIGNSASGIDLPSPEINTDIKVTSIKQPQSSCPYTSSRQKIFGLGYNLLVLVYDKGSSDGSHLNYTNCTFIEKSRTSDFLLTKKLKEMILEGAIKEDIIGYFYDKQLPGDEIVLDQLADEVMQSEITQGYLTISNALQWRLQYRRAIGLKNSIVGINNYDLE
jgi:hypothetical protein